MLSFTSVSVSVVFFSQRNICVKLSILYQWITMTEVNMLPLSKIFLLVSYLIVFEPQFLQFEVSFDIFFPVEHFLSNCFFIRSRVLFYFLSLFFRSLIYLLCNGLSLLTGEERETDTVAWLCSTVSLPQDKLQWNY